MSDASTPAVLPRPAIVALRRGQWEPEAAAHAARVDALTAAHRERASRGERHAIEDFLYDYYGTKVSLLRRWHPGPGIVLEDAAEHATWRWYTTDSRGTRLDADHFYAERGATVDWVAALVAALGRRPAHLGCFGMHEWAMVYRATDAERRHGLPLRLGREGTDAVVESHPLACSHYDAYRFFTPEASPLNAAALSRADQARSEQPGCLHATMDLYKWCAKLAPAVPSSLTVDAFELALDVRRIDMRASPYDVTSYGLDPIAVETPRGKREYAEYQRGFMERAAVVREALLDCLALAIPEDFCQDLPHEGSLGEIGDGRRLRAGGGDGSRGTGSGGMG
jgi:hypothetical protein